MWTGRAGSGGLTLHTTSITDNKEQFQMSDLSDLTRRIPEWVEDEQLDEVTSLNTVIREIAFTEMPCRKKGCEAAPGAYCRNPENYKTYRGPLYKRFMHKERMDMARGRVPVSLAIRYKALEDENKMHRDIADRCGIQRYVVKRLIEHYADKDGFLTVAHKDDLAEALSPDFGSALAKTYRLPPVSTWSLKRWFEAADDWVAVKVSNRLSNVPVPSGS